MTRVTEEWRWEVDKWGKGDDNEEEGRAGIEGGERVWERKEGDGWELGRRWWGKRSGGQGCGVEWEGCGAIKGGLWSPLLPHRTTLHCSALHSTASHQHSAALRCLNNRMILLTSPSIHSMTHPPTNPSVHVWRPLSCLACMLPHMLAWLSLVWFVRLTLRMDGMITYTLSFSIDSVIRSAVRFYSTHFIFISSTFFYLQIHFAFCLLWVLFDGMNFFELINLSFLHVIFLLFYQSHADCFDCVIAFVHKIIRIYIQRLKKEFNL